MLRVFLSLLSEISIGSLTLWLLIKDGLVKMSPSFGSNQYTILRAIKRIDFWIKIIAVLCFIFGITIKLWDKEQNSNFHNKIYYKLSTIEEKLSEQTEQSLDNPYSLFHDISF